MPPFYSHQESRFGVYYSSWRRVEPYAGGNGRRIRASLATRAGLNLSREPEHFCTSITYPSDSGPTWQRETPPVVCQPRRTMAP